MRKIWVTFFAKQIEEDEREHTQKKRNNLSYILFMWPIKSRVGEEKRMKNEWLKIVATVARK